jgi:hypothetical protein
MAAFNVVGFKEIEKELLRQSEKAERLAPKMLEAGAEVLIAEQKRQLRRVTGSGSGTLADSIGASEVKKTRSKLGHHINVYPQGNQPHGTPTVGKKKKRGPVSNAQVGFIIEYGTSDTPAKPWMSVAEEVSADAVNEAMRRVWESDDA